MTGAIKIILLITIILSSAEFSIGQTPTYTLAAKNFQRRAADSLTFEIYMLHTNSNYFEYAAGQYFFTFNPAFSNGGTLTYRIIGSGLPQNAQPRNPTVSGNELRLAGNAIVGQGNGPIISATSPGTLIVKMSLKTSAGSFSSSELLNLAWKNSGAPYTRIYAYVNMLNTEITTPAAHSIDTTTISVSKISAEIPQEFRVYQNYPNPFNPSTMIRFDIPNASNVKIKIYDIAGKELEELVNTKLLPGTYEFRWSALNLASGIYFYKIQTNNKSEVRRMMLLK